MCLFVRAIPDPLGPAGALEGAATLEELLLPAIEQIGILPVPQTGPDFLFRKVEKVLTFSHGTAE
jgi:hypothetical protein